jgi:hypothetical protein
MDRVRVWTGKEESECAHGKIGIISSPPFSNFAFFFRTLPSKNSTDAKIRPSGYREERNVCRTRVMKRSFRECFCVFPAEKGGEMRIFRKMRKEIGARLWKFLQTVSVILSLPGDWGRLIP